jgi:hypothetical protein
MGDVRNAYKTFVGRSERKRNLGRHRHRWEDNIKMYLWEMVWEGVNCMHQA